MMWAKDGFAVSDRREDKDVSMIHDFLSESYWARGIDKAIVEQSIQYSLCLGFFQKGAQIGFGRATTGRSIFSSLTDIFVLEPSRGQGHGKWLIDWFLRHPDLQGLRRWLVAMADAHGLYQQKGFVPLAEPKRFMEKSRTSTKRV